MSESTKEFLKTPRGKSLIKLGLFVIFFSIIFIYYNISSEMPHVTPKKDALLAYGEMSNYEYTYKYNELMYTGKVYRNKMYFQIEDMEYKLDDDIYVMDTDGNYIVTTLDKLYYYDNVSIYNLIKEGTVVSKTEDFETGYSITKYLVNDCYIETYIKDDIVSKVTFTNSENYIEIEYKNIGQVLNPEVQRSN